MKNNYRRYLRPAIALVLVVLLVKLGLSFFHKDNTLLVIRTVRAVKGDIAVTVQSSGSVKPYNRVEMKPPIAGRVEQVLVEEGDTVKQGQVLAWMSSIERAALLDSARAQGPEILKRWQDAYKPAPLISPLDGTVIVRGVQPGQTVATSDAVVVLSDRLIVQALVDETDLARINLGQKTRIELDAYPGQEIPGKVDHISYESQLVNNVNMYAIDIIPDETPPFFRSGMTASITFLVTEHPGVLTLPSEAISQWPRKMPRPEGAEFAVYRKGFGGKPVPVPVTIGASDGSRTEITSGLKEGEEILVVRRKENTAKSAFGGPGGRPAGRSGAGGAGGGRRPS